MSTVTNIIGINLNADKEKKQALQAISTMKSLRIDVPQELYDILNKESININHCIIEHSEDGYYEQRVDLSALPENVNMIAFTKSW